MGIHPRIYSRLEKHAKGKWGRSGTERPRIKEVGRHEFNRSQNISARDQNGAVRCTKTGEFYHDQVNRTLRKELRQKEGKEHEPNAAEKMQRSQRKYLSRVIWQNLRGAAPDNTQTDR